MFDKLLLVLSIVSILFYFGCGSTTMETGKITERKPRAQVSAGLTQSAVLSSSLSNLPSLRETRKYRMSETDLRLLNIWASKNPARWLFQRKRFFNTSWNKILK